MNTQLFKALQKPTLWQRSTAPFWDDEHISKGMLEAHMDSNRDSASRKLETIEHSVKWIASVIPPGCDILDLGCGPGLYCKRLSDRGFHVTGIDFSKRSVDFAKEHDKNTTYLYQDYLEMKSVDSFDVVLMIYCDYAALTLSERQKLLSRVYAALKPNGVFLFDVFTDLHFKDKTEKNNWTLYRDGGFWSDLPHVHLEGAYFYESNTVAVRQNIIVTEKEIKEYLIWDTVYTAQSLKEELLPFGFQVDAVYDDVCGSRYTGDSQTLCFVARKPGK